MALQTDDNKIQGFFIFPGPTANSHSAKTKQYQVISATVAATGS